MKNLIEKKRNKLATINIVELLNEEHSLNIQGGGNKYEKYHEDQKETESMWQKATSMLDDLI